MSSPQALFRGRLVPICRRVSAPTAVMLLAALPAASSARTCTTLTLGQKSSGRTVILHRCDRLTIRLKEQFDGGYQWKVTRRPSPKVLKLISNQAVPSVKGVVGGSDTRVIVYRAVGRGATSLRLTEARSFQAHSQIAQFTLVIRVR